MPSRSGHVRAALPHDAAAIARLHIRSWQVGYRGQLPDAFLDALGADLGPRTARWQRSITEAKARGQVQLVAEQDDSVVGFVTFGPSEDEPRDGGMGEVYAIYVDPDHWDRGYGRSLFTAAVRGLADAGFGTATLWVLESNARARRFYEIAGWRVDGARRIERRGDVELREVRYRSALSRAASS